MAGINCVSLNLRLRIVVAFNVYIVPAKLARARVVKWLWLMPCGLSDRQVTWVSRPWRSLVVSPSFGMEF